VTAVFFQLVWKVHYGNSLKGAFFDAYAAAAAEHFRDHCLVAFYSYGFHAATHHRAETNARLTALFHFALVRVQYSNSGHGKLNLNNEVSLVINMDLKNHVKITRKRVLVT
jgi:hypothetical protein